MSESQTPGLTSEFLQLLLSQGFPLHAWDANRALIAELSQGLTDNDAAAVSGTLLLLKTEMINQKLSSREYLFFSNLFASQAMAVSEELKYLLEKTSHEFSALAQSAALNPSPAS
jgi:hypothetical protein